MQKLIGALKIEHLERIADIVINCDDGDAIVTLIRNSNLFRNTTSHHVFLCIPKTDSEVV